MVPSALGSMNDIVARLVAKQLSQQLGQSINIDNQAGSNGTTAADSVAKSAPDGYTLFLGNEATQATNIHLKKLFPYDPLTDFTPLASLAEDHLVLIAHPSLPAKNVAELVEHAKKNKITYASIGAGSSYHLAGVLLGSRAGAKMIHAEYVNVAEATNALFDNKAQIMFLSGIVAKRHVGSGKAKALAIADAKPYAPFGDLAPVGATLPGFALNGWFGLFAPAKLPPAITARLNDEINKALAANDVKSRLGPALLLLTPTGGKSEELAAMLKDDSAKRAGLIKAAGIEPD